MRGVLVRSTFNVRFIGDIVFAIDDGLPSCTVPVSDMASFMGDPER